MVLPDLRDPAAAVPGHRGRAARHPRRGRARRAAPRRQAGRAPRPRRQDRQEQARLVQEDHLQGTLHHILFPTHHVIFYCPCVL